MTVKTLSTSDQSSNARAVDSVFVSFSLLLKLLNVPHDAALLKRDYGKTESWTVDDVQNVSKQLLGLKVKRRSISQAKLPQLPTPFLMETHSDKCVLVVKYEESGTALIQDPETQSLKTVTQAVLWKMLTGQVMLFKTKSADEKALNNKFGLGWFVRSLLEEKAVMTQVLLAAIFIQLFALIAPLFSMVVMDKVFTAGRMDTLNVLFIGVVAFAVFEFILTMLRKHILSHATAKLDVILSAKVFTKLTRLPIHFFSQRQTGDTVNRLKELESIRSFISGHGLTALIDFPFSIIILGVMFLFSPTITMVAVIAIVLFFVLYAVIGPLLKDRVNEKHKVSVDNQSYLVETVRGMDTLKSMALEAQMQRRWEKQVAEQSVLSTKSEDMSGKVSEIGQFISKGTIALTMYLGAMGVMNGTLTAGQMIAMNMLAGRVMGPAQRIAQMFMQMHQVGISVKRIGEILDADSEPNIRHHHQHMPAIKGGVNFDQVSFKYSDQSPTILDGISFDVKAGEVIGIVGESGAGKTTLSKLMLKLYLPNTGKISLDGLPLSQYDPVWLRSHVGVVLQDNLLFNISIRDNIAISNPSLSNEAVENAAKLAGVDEFIHHLEHGYDTPVGEVGGLLSAGQRQRISIARALVNDPKILILDEATSHLDSKSEKIIQDNMASIVKGRTTFVIAHRLSTLNVCDRIMVIEHGRIVEMGTRQALLEKKGLFNEFYQLQMMGGAA